MPAPSPIGLPQLTLKSGKAIHPGKLYRDNRPDNVRVLRVALISPPHRPDLPPELHAVHCTVIAQTYQGTVTHPNRTTKMRARRITSREFVEISEASL